MKEQHLDTLPPNATPRPVTGDVTPAAARAHTANRIAALDVLRGLAVFGILVVNVQQMFIPIYLANDPVALQPNEFGASLAWFTTDAFFESKFLTVFSLLFGAGFCLQWRRFEHAPRSFRSLYLRRVAVLVLFGLIHATCFYYADVLVLYGLSALFLLGFRHAPGGRMLRAGVWVLAFMTVWHVALSAPEPAGAERQGHLVTELHAIRATGVVTLGGERFTLPVPADAVAAHLHGDMHDTDEAKAQLLAFAYGPPALAVRARVTMFLKFITLFTPFYLLWRTLALFLIAAGLVKLGALESRNRSRWKRTAALGLGLGVPVSIVASLVRLHAVGAPGAMTFVGAALHDVSALLMAGGIGALVLLTVTSATGAFTRGLQAVGRLALTNYIGQSVITTVVATSIGLGLYGGLTRLELLALCVPVFTAQAVGSLLWLRMFRMGPLEWIWRCATYRTRIPLRARQSGLGASDE